MMLYLIMKILLMNDTANIDNADNNNTDIEEPPIGSDTELQESVVLDEQ